MKPKRQEDSSCVFAYRFCRGTCHRRDTAGKRKSAERISAQVKKKAYPKAAGTVRRKNRQGRGKLPPLYAAVRVRHRSCREGISPIRHRADHRTPAESSAAEFSGMVSATAPPEQGIFAPCGSVLTQHK